MCIRDRLDLGTNTTPQTAQRFKSLSRKILASSVPSSGRTAQRNHLQQTEKETVCGQVQVSPSSKDNAVAVLTATALPAYQADRLFPLCRCHAVKGTVRPAFQRRQVFIGFFSHAFPPFCFPLPFSPKRFPAPFLRRIPALARSPQLRDILSRSPAPCDASPAGVFLFGRSFCFQGAVHR